MYLQKLHIHKFRSIDHIDIIFNKGLNIIVGENNAGKTAIIDALRICLGYGKQWREIGIRNDEDFYIDQSTLVNTIHPIEFDLHFAIECNEDRQFFNSMVWQDPADPQNQEIQLHFRYSLQTSATGTTTLKWNTWGGAHQGQSIDTNEAQLLFFTYLAPLRNAEQELRPYTKDNKVTSLFKNLSSFNTTEADGTISKNPLTPESKQKLAGKLESVVQDKEWAGLIETGAKFVNEHLTNADIHAKASRVNIRLVEYNYDSIVKGVLTRKPVYNDGLLTAGNEHKQRYFDVNQNGLGENNLIYAAAVLGDLKNRRAEKKEHYYALLIEEPEAHLHPQRQNTFFNYLNNLQDLGVQIFITSHSPTITSKTNLDSLIVLQQEPNKRHPFTIRHSELSEHNKSHLRKFLDVTKSQLFFSNGTILLEGISESLLLPVFSKMMGKTYDLDLNGIEAVNLGGVAFEPFGKLYNPADPEKRLSTRCAILTDDDRGYVLSSNFIDVSNGITAATAKQIHLHLQSENIIDPSNRILIETDEVFNAGSFSEHTKHINDVLNKYRNAHSERAINAAQMKGGNLSTETAVYTFEYELMTASEENYRLMMGIYKRMHPRTDFEERTAPIKRRALDFLVKLDSNKDKAQFAENLAQALQQRLGRTKFIVPAYVQRAISWVVKGI